jgi:hypothetical protein
MPRRINARQAYSAREKDRSKRSLAPLATLLKYDQRIGGDALRP